MTNMQNNVYLQKNEQITYGIVIEYYIADTINEGYLLITPYILNIFY